MNLQSRKNKFIIEWRKHHEEEILFWVGIAVGGYFLCGTILMLLFQLDQLNNITLKKSSVNEIKEFT